MGLETESIQQAVHKCSHQKPCPLGSSLAWVKSRLLRLDSSGQMSSIHPNPISTPQLGSHQGLGLHPINHGQPLPSSVVGWLGNRDHLGKSLLTKGELEHRAWGAKVRKYLGVLLAYVHSHLYSGKAGLASRPTASGGA